MTDPTPTRAEVEALLQLLTDRAPRDGIWTQQRQAADMIAALRERVGAAERDRDEALNQLDSAKHSVDVLCRRITNTNAAWNDAIEAAANVSGHYMSDDADETLLDMWREDIRALRRAAPTEGEA